MVMPEPKSPITIFWNTGAGWDEGDKEAEVVKGVLTKVDPNLQFQSIKRGDDIGKSCRSCVDSGAQTLVAAGGDGTINAVASAAVATSKTLGVIPAGTLNHFARDLEISLDPAEAAEQFRTGHEIKVDVGTVNGRIFINNSVLGLYPVYRTARRSIESHGFGSTRIGRFFSIVGGIIQVFLRLPHLKLRFVTENETRQIKTPFVLIANNEHELETWRIGHRRAMNEGFLWIYVMRKCSRLTLLRFFASFLFKQFSRHDAFEIFKVKEIRIESKRKEIRVGIDGEVVRMKTPLQYASKPEALRVIAPMNYLPERSGKE